MTDDDPRFTWRRRTTGWNPSALGDTLDRFLAQMGAPPVAVVSELHLRWGEVVGPALAEQSRPVEILDGVLTVACVDGPWASQLGWMESQIKDRCAVVFNGLEVTRLQLRIGY